MNATAELPALSILAVVLTASTWSDVARHRIPNIVCGIGIVMALGVAALGWGLVGMVASLGGLGAGLLLFLPFYIKKIMGAGDVKLLATVGAFLGPWGVLWAAAFTLIAGSVLGLLVLFRKDGLRETFSRYFFAIKHFFLGGVWLGKRASGEGEQGPLRFPYAVAIASGTVLSVVLRAQTGA